MKTWSNYQKQGKLVFNYIYTGTSALHIDGKSVKVDDSTPVTLERMADIHARLCEKTGEKLGEIKLCLSAFEPGDFDGANSQLWAKEYIYNPIENSLLIREDGKWVYANENGTITTDLVALADSM